jgi:chromosomal replication initiation ATPase DnaA
MKTMKTIEQIALGVALATGVVIPEMRARTNRPDIAVARNMFFYLCVKDGHTTERIGDEVCRDHSTVSIQSRRFADALEVGDPVSCDYFKKYEAL